MLLNEEATIVEGILKFESLDSTFVLTDQDPEVLINLPKINVLTTPEKVGFTYHCNEPSYSKVEVTHMIGLLIN